MMSKQKPGLTKPEKKDNLKVIAFKLPESQVNSIKNLCANGFYPSLSETVRIAITDYISHVIDVTQNQNQSKGSYWLSMSDQDILTASSNKISACTKMPSHLLKTIDNLILENSQSFNNRTNFIRLAINKFLESDIEIYDYWLSKQYKSNDIDSRVDFKKSDHIQAMQ